MTSEILDDFYEKTTVSFDVYIKKNNVLQTPIGVVSIIFKTNKSDSDEDAVISVEAESYTTTSARIALSAPDTAVTPGSYYYEIRWKDDDIEHILLSSTINILERVYD